MGRGIGCRGQLSSTAALPRRHLPRSSREAEHMLHRCHHGVMDDALRAIAQARGVFLRREARDLGYDDQALATAVRAGLWVRVRRGAYTYRDVWQAQDPVGRHRITSHAVMRSLGNSVALSHISAVIEHGIAVWGTDLSRGPCHAARRRSGSHRGRRHPSRGSRAGRRTRGEGWDADDKPRKVGHRSVVAEPG
jgi:hypothetical protein